MVLPALASEASRRHPDRAAFTGAGWQLTFRDLDRCSDALAVRLARLGVRAGDVVALVLPTCVDHPLAYLATAKLGAVTAAVNARLPVAQRARLLALAAPRLLVTAYDDDIGGPAEVLEIEQAAEGPAALSLSDVDGEAPPLLAPDPDRPVAVVFTSGTTGLPRGAVFRERQLQAVRATDVGTAWGGGGRSLAGTSLAHLGFMTKFAGQLQSGATSRLLARWSPGVALRLTAELGLSSLSGVPTQLALVLAEAERTGTALPALRGVVVGGGPVTPALVRRARAVLGVPVTTRYSCTEAALGCGTSAADPPEDAEDTVGRPLPGVTLALRDADGRDVGVGDVGEVLLRSAAVMSGYWRDPDATAAAFTADGFVRTGDLGRLDERGRLRLVGRAREMYVRGGYNVFPVAVEAVLSAAPGVRAVAVGAVPDEVLGQVGVAVVVPDDPARPPTLQHLREHAAVQLARHELPERLLVTDALPLTPGDKLDRSALQVLAASAPDPGRLR